MSINYTERIPNNVDLGSNRILQRALEHWQPEFLNWWQELGPRDFQVADVYLRTATSVDAKGWATYGFVRMPEYRWGIFLAERDRQPQDRLRRQLRAGCLAADSRRVSRHAAPADRHPGRYRAGVGRAAAHARPHRAVALRFAQPVSGECRRRPAPVGDGVPAACLLRARWPRRGGGVAGAALGRRRQAAHSGHLQRADPRLAQLLHVHLLHRPRRQVPVEVAGRVELRSRWPAPVRSC